MDCDRMLDLSRVGDKPKKEKLTVLTAEDQKQRDRLRSKWQKIAQSTDRINRPRAEKTIQAIYAYANKPSNQKRLYTPNYLFRKLRYKLNQAIRQEVARSLRIELHDYFLEQPLCEFSTVLYEDLESKMGLTEPIAKLEMGMYAYYEFMRRLIDPKPVETEWKLLQTWAKEGQWSFAFEDLCLICDRPTEIVIPKAGKPGTVMLKFADGVSF
jgi:hypothetical protein